jgi:hypothetical protein
VTSEHISVLSSKIYDAIHDRNIDLVPTYTKLIMGDGRIVRPLGIACNLKVIIFEKMHTHRLLYCGCLL